MSEDKSHFVVVGGGHAAGQLLESLRKEGFNGKLTLVSEERLLPYQRPHLSKLYLAGTLSEEKLLYRPSDFYPKNKVDVILNQRVEAILPEDKTIRLADGSSLGYDKLALTTGARVRQLNIPGVEQQGVFYIRTVDDTDRIREALTKVKHIVMIGGGFLGLEAASVMTAQGKNINVLEMQQRVMATALASETSTFYEKLHRDKGVDIRTDVLVESIQGQIGKVSHVVCKDGQSFAADLVIISIGIIPNIELAQEAGLHCDNGICVDEFAVSSNVDIVAAGDCTTHPNGFLQRKLRLESVHNAVEQAKTAAASMCGIKKIYQQVPWFWSDQYDYRLQMVGIPGNNNRTIIRGDINSGRFSILFFDNEKLTACHAVNRPRDYMNCRKILENNISLSPGDANDSNFDLASLIPGKAKLAFQKRGSELAA